MSAKRYLTVLGFVAALAAAGPAAAVTTVKIVAADGTWLNYVTYTKYNLLAIVSGTGFSCTGASIGVGKFYPNGASATCSSTGTATVYLSGGEWWINYP
jgi:hypothetical protein